MESPPAVFYIAALLLSILLLLKTLTSFRRSRPRNQPPGPKPWPIIGNLNLMGLLPHRSIHTLSQKYGPIMRLRFGSFPIIIGSSADAAKIFLKTQDLNFASRPKTAAGKYTTYNYANMTWSPYGAYWRQARRMCLLELFTARRLESYEYIRVEELRRLLRNLFNSSGKPVVLKHLLSNLTLSIISRMVLGKNYSEVAAEGKKVVVTPEEFNKMLDELFVLNGVLNVGDWIPWLGFLDLQGYVGRMKVVGRKFDRFMEHVLDEHNERRRAEGKAFVANDKVDVLLDYANDPGLDVKFTRDSVKAFTQDLIAGGTETSAMTMECAISELVKHPDILQKAQEELDRVIGPDRWVKEEEVHRLPYIEAIVKETMRMHPVAPLLVPHLSREDTTVAGYDVPAGTRVVVNIWSIGHHPAIWAEPDEYKPDCFLGSPIDVNGQHFELLPFGTGRRMCPGYSLGLKVVQVSLANLLHGFKWRLPDGMKAEELSMEEIFGLSTPRKEPLEVVVEPRLATHLYGV